MGQEADRSLTPLIRIRYLIVVSGLSCWLGVPLAEETAGMLSYRDLNIWSFSCHFGGPVHCMNYSCGLQSPLNVPVLEQFSMILVKFLIDHPSGKMTHLVRERVTNSL
jgi:hypothetical protein